MSNGGHADDDIELGPDGVDAYLGSVAGSYVITKCLGRGGMGAVYQAEHPTIGSKVAVKFLHRRYASDKGIVDRFFNEARAVNLIGHDNIVKVSDFSQLEDGSPYFIMEFLEGKALAALTGTPQPLRELGPIFLQVADGLQAAHDKGIIHRDLKPDNIFLVTRNRRGNFVKIVDFGIAKLQGAGGSSGKTQTGMVMGTAQYMSPEQAGGEVNKIGAPSDVYSVGVIMFQLATGRLPFEGANFGELLIGHLMRPPPAPRSLVPEISEAYEAIILKCLEKKQEDRFGSMFELYEALGAVLDAEGLPREPPLARATASSNPGMQHFASPQSRPPMATPAAGEHEGSAQLLGHAKAKVPTQPTNVPPGGTLMMPKSRPPAPWPVAAGGTAMLAPAPKKGPPIALIAGVAAVVLGGLGAAVALRKPAEPTIPVVAVAVKTPPAPLAPPPPVVPQLVKVLIGSTPAGAKLTLTQGDSTHEAITPATIELRPGEPAKAHLELEGYAALDETLTPTKESELRLSLSELPKAAPEPAVAKARSPATEKRPAKDADAAVGDGTLEVSF